MIGLMVVMLMVLFTCDKLVLVLWGVGPILTNECRIWGQNYVALFQDNEMSAWLHSRNLILGLEFFFFFALSIQWKSSPYCFCVAVNQEN